jgi:hypothetical protein
MKISESRASKANVNLGKEKVLEIKAHQKLEIPFKWEIYFVRKTTVLKKKRTN